MAKKKKVGQASSLFAVVQPVTSVDRLEACPTFVLGVSL